MGGGVRVDVNEELRAILCNHLKSCATHSHQSIVGLVGGGQGM